MKHRLKLWIVGCTLTAIGLIEPAGVTGFQRRPYLFNKLDAPLKIDVNLVTVNVTVTDARGSPVTGLDRTDFRVWEDKVEQKIVSLDTEEGPASIGIILDVSDSMKRKLSAARDAAAEFVKDGTANDEYFVVAFGNRARIAQTFTTDISKVAASIALKNTSGMTAMYDALYLGVEKMKSGHYARKALLLITDGEDNRSRYTFNDIDEVLKENDVQVYPIGITDEGKDLKELAEISGGGAFFPDSARELEDICSRVAIELKSQYVIAYRSTNGIKDGRWRKLKVRVRQPGLKNLTVRSRPGFYAPSH